MTLDADARLLLSQTLETLAATAVKIEAVGQTLATLQATIEALEAGGMNSEVMVMLRQVVDKAAANDLALATLQGA